MTEQHTTQLHQRNEERTSRATSHGKKVTTMSSTTAHRHTTTTATTATAQHNEDNKHSNNKQMKQQTQQQRRQRLDNCMFGLAVVAGLSLLLVLATVAYFVINPIDGPPTRLQIEVLVCNSRHIALTSEASASGLHPRNTIWQ